MAHIEKRSRRGRGDSGAAFVWRAGQGVVNKVTLKLGERDARSGDVRVLEGLAPGDRVLRNPGGTLAEGQKFEFASKAAAAASAASAAGAR